MNILGPSHESFGGEDACTFLEEECNEDEDSDEDYASIQRPAFLVEGEPDFESGPPEDGLEYLRRVRYYIISLHVFLQLMVLLADYR